MEDGQRPSAAANGVVAPPLPPAALATKPRAGTVDGSKRFTPETQASVGSQGGGCPGVTDVNRGAKQGVISDAGTGESHPTEAVAGRRVRGDGKEVERDVVQEMPCVSATGDGPNGRRVEGFLYRFRKDVRIVCVCHGRFFTPAEFVEHAGGGDVAHPLRRIVVNPFPSAFP
ncbi:ninja-family protein [Musa troglodytarum]|uniref:Ninja-family protein n=1 Tax=Musa troglodytarum TaxID=320322 RepID=A0A9E7JVC0_9LILI|nr:ninja-family protein [Musa troglodytarum]